MKKLNRLIAFIALSAASFTAAVEPTVSSKAGGSEMVMTIATHGAVMKTEAASFATATYADLLSFEHRATAIIPDATAKVAFQNVGKLQQSRHTYALATPVCKLKLSVSAQPNQPTASTKVAAVSTHVRLKVDHRALASDWFTCAALSPPTTSLAPDKPEAGLAGTAKTPSAWHMPAAYDPAPKIAQVRDLT